MCSQTDFSSVAKPSSSRNPFRRNSVTVEHIKYGPQIGSHWANTYMTAPVASNGKISMLTPPADMLVWLAPNPNGVYKLWIEHWKILEPRLLPDNPLCLEGTPIKGERRHVTQVYYPHGATNFGPRRSNLGARCHDGGHIAATAGRRNRRHPR